MFVPQEQDSMTDTAQDATTDDAQDALTQTESTTAQDAKLTGFDALPEETKAEIRKLRREAAGYRKELDAARTEQKQREDAEATKKGEWEKLATERADMIADLERQIADRDRQDRKRAAAKKHNLPDELIDRLAGETDEELEADAKSLTRFVVSRDPAKPGNGPNPKAATPKTDIEAAKEKMRRNISI